jgi:hypothetical protein
MWRQTNTTARLLSDLAMAGVFIALMTYRYTGITAHEFLGLTLILLIFVHIFLNLRWYATISKGTYTLLRSVRAAVNILLLSAFLGMLASSFMVSKVVFAFVGIKGELFARNLHLFFTNWPVLAKIRRSNTASPTNGRF